VEIDAGGAANLREDHQDLATGAAPPDCAGRTQVDAQLRRLGPRATVGAGAGGGCHLSPEHFEQPATERVAIERVHRDASSRKPRGFRKRSTARGWIAGMSAAATDWAAWHDAYADPDSSLSRRLRIVHHQILR